jgi:hypothetical protein
MSSKQLIEKVNNRIIDFIISDNPYNLTLMDLFSCCTLEELKAYYKHSSIVGDDETIKLLDPIIEFKLKLKILKEIK